MVAAWQSVAARSESLGADLVITKPTGTVDGDLLVFVGVPGVGQSITKPDASWTTASFSLGAGSPCFWKLASGEPASWTFVVSGSVSSVGQVARFNGVDPVTPVGVGAGNAVAGAGGLVIPSVSPTGDNNLLGQMVCKLNNTTMTGPAGVEQWDALAASQSVVYAGGSETVGAGPTGTRTWTPAAGSGPFVAYMFEINPVPPEEGTFTGSYDFSGSGFTGQAGPGEGQFTGGYDFSGSFTGEAPGVASGSFTGGYDFSGAFTGVAPPPTPGGDNRWTPGGRDRFTARRTPKNRRRSR